jgi:hypothetical protein
VAQAPPTYVDLTDSLSRVRNDAASKGAEVERLNGEVQQLQDQSAAVTSRLEASISRLAEAVDDVSGAARASEPAAVSDGDAYGVLDKAVAIMREQRSALLRLQGQLAAAHAEPAQPALRAFDQSTSGASQANGRPQHEALVAGDGHAPEVRGRSRRLPLRQYRSR